MGYEHGVVCDQCDKREHGVRLPRGWVEVHQEGRVGSVGSTKTFCGDACFDSYCIDRTAKKAFGG